MKATVLDLISKEIRVFNERKQNWEVQTFQEAQYSIDDRNFAEIVEMFQENNLEEFEVTFIFEWNDVEYRFKLFEDTINLNFKEVFDPRSKEVWILDEKGKAVFCCKDKNWPIGSLQKQVVELPDEIGSTIQKECYVYHSEIGDCFDVYSLLNKLQDYY